MTKTMDRSKQAERYFHWKRFQGEHSQGLIEFAKKTGFYDEQAPTEFILAEAYSRTLGAKIALQNYPDCKLYSMPLYWHFDYLLVDGDGSERGIEVKFRLNDSDEYPTDSISKDKKDFNADTIPIDLYYIFYDGKVRVYDLNGKSKEGMWEHQSTTASIGSTITNQSISFDHADALWTTTVSVPL